jgi:hypothetical protein
VSKFRGWLKRLERAASEDLESFELLDGSTYFCNRLATSKELFLYAYDVELGDADKWPDPPEYFLKLLLAKDPAAVLKRFMPEDPERAFVDLSAIYDMDALVHERRLVPLTHAPTEDLSEP